MIFGNEDLMKFDDVGVLYFFEDGDFPKSSLGIGSMLKRFEYFFEGISFSIGFMEDFPDVAIGAGAKFLDNLVSVQDGRLDSLVGGHGYKNKLTVTIFYATKN